MELSRSHSTKSFYENSDKQSKCNYPLIPRIASLQALSDLQILLKSKENILTKVRRLKMRKRQNIDKLHLTDLRQKLQINLRKINSNNSNINNNNTCISPISSSTFPSSTFKMIKSNSQLNIPTQLSLEIGSLFNANYRNVRDFTSLHGHLSKLREIVKDQKVYSRQKEIEIQTKKQSLDDSVTNLQLNYNQIATDILDLDQYISFLKQANVKERVILEQYDNEKSELKGDIRNLMLTIDKLKKKRELSLNYRNFFVCVKEHLLVLPDEFTDSLYQRSDKKKRTLVYNQRNINSKEKLKLNKRKSKDDSNSINNSGRNLNETYEKIINEHSIQLYLNPEVLIFNSSEAFYQRLTNYDNQNLKLAQEYNNSVLELEKYKEQLTTFEIEHKTLKKNNAILQHKYEKQIRELKQDNKSLTSTHSKLKKAIESKRNKRDFEEYMLKNRSVMQKANLPLFRYDNYCNELKFTTTFAYVFYYASKLMKYIYHEKPYLFKEQLDAPFKVNRLKNILAHLSNPDSYHQSTLRDECLYCFKLLEIGVNNLVITEKNYKENTSIKERLDAIEDQRKTKRTFLNSKEHRFLQEKKRKDKINELREKSNKVLYKSHSGLMFNSNHKANQNKIPINTNSSLFLYGGLRSDISEKSQ